MEVHDIFAELKARNPIEDVIAEGGYTLKEHGKYRKAAPGSGGLVINTQEQLYFWNVKQEGGDVFTWLEKRNGWDAKEAARFLARRCHMPEPVFGHENVEVRKEIRKKEDTFEVAAAIFEQWLWNDEKALAYARGRGWSDGTIRAAHLGYSGAHPQNYNQELSKQLRKELGESGTEFDGPAATALTGRVGDVGEWAAKHEIKLPKEWTDKNKIPGLAGQDMLIYPHIEGGRTVYFSGRCISEKRHYNLPVELVGPKKLFFNVEWKNTDSRVICEGQADAVSLAQWGIPAMALVGVSASEDLFRTFKNKTFYIGLDADSAGKVGASKVAQAIGPMCRLINWGFAAVGSQDKEIHIKDANDVLKAMNASEMPLDEQKSQIISLMKRAKTYVEATAALAGECEGVEKEEAQKKTVELMLRMDDMDRSMKLDQISKLMGVQISTVNRLLKSAVGKERRETTEDAPELIYGGAIGNHLIEYLYDPETKLASLAWRDPEGVVKTGDQVQIDGKWYAAAQDDANVLEGGVLFPSALGSLHSTRELSVYIEQYINSVYLLRKKMDAKIISYYILLTWLYDCFYAIPYLRAMGEAESGKSEMMFRIAMICYRRILCNGANSTSSFFRMGKQYQGTVVIDETDIKVSDASVELIKYINSGYNRNGRITRMEEATDENGRKYFKATMYPSFCPKLMTNLEEFDDPAVSTRCITFMLHPAGMKEIDDANISLEIDEDMEQRALVLRNKLVRWRLEKWQSRISIQREHRDFDISPRLNQISGPMMSIAHDEPEMQEEIRTFLRAYHKEIVLDRSTTPEAKIIEAMWKIYLYSDLHKEMVITDTASQERILVGNIAKIANEIIDIENMEENENEEGGGKKRKKRFELRPRGVGEILRKKLSLNVKKINKGYVALWNPERMEDLANRYGINQTEILEEGKKPRLVTNSLDNPQKPDEIQEALIPDNEDAR